MPINKFTTLLDLARQAKIITGETATFDGKIQAGIPFSGYPTGVDTGTTVSLGVVSTQTAIFSGNTGTTIFDVSNPSSPNYSPLFSGFSGNVWTNSLFSGNTSGLTLPITTFSADTQVVGPFWVLTQTGMTGDYVIGTQYTGYSITYAFSFINDLGAPTTAFTSYSGYTTASQENFSAGTLDYKGPLDYISTKEDASVEGRLTTNKITITNGASASTIGYVLTQTGENGEAEWVINASADTNTYVTGGTLTGTDLTLDWNTGGSANTIDLSGLEFTGNTSGDCITDLYVRRLYGCSPITVHDTITYNGSIIDSATTNSFIFGTNHVLTGSSVTHGVTVDANAILGGSNNRIVPFQLGTYNTIIGGENNTLGVGRIQSSAIISSDDSTIDGSTGPNVILGGTNNIINGGNGSVIIGGLNNTTQSGVDNSSILGGSNNIILSNVERSVVLGGSGITGTTNDTVYTPNLETDGEVSMINRTYPNKKIYTNLSTSGESTFNISGYTEDISELSVYSDMSKNLRFGVVGSNVGESYPFGISEDAYIYSNEYNKSLNIISNYEVVCPSGFDVLGENCVSTTAATTVTAETIVKAVTSTSYNKFGARFCVPNSYTTCGSGATASNFYSITGDPFWGDDPAGPTDGRLNNVGVWVNEPPVIEDEWIGFSRCITASTDGQYLIGLAGDNGIRFSVDGELLVENPWDGTITQTRNFNYWWVWPIDLIAGEHSIVLEGYDDSSSAAFGCEIIGPYPTGTFTTNTDFEFFTGTTGKNSYTANTIFSSIDQTGSTFDTQANTCPSGYTYDICSGLCVKYEIPTLSGKTGDVKIYAGKTITDGGEPDLFIKGKSTNRGNVGINNGDPTSKLDISGTTGYQQLRLRNSYTPTTSGDTNGEIGDISWDDNYIYVKTNSGWGRSSLDYGF